MFVMPGASGPYGRTALNYKVVVIITIIAIQLFIYVLT
jgi:hypothetical protein